MSEEPIGDEEIDEDTIDAMCDEMCEGPDKCPHGEEWGECDHCDFLGDIAADAAREDRIYGRR